MTEEDQMIKSQSKDVILLLAIILLCGWVAYYLFGLVCFGMFID